MHVAYVCYPLPLRPLTSKGGHYPPRVSKSRPGIALQGRTIARPVRSRISLPSPLVHDECPQFHCQTTTARGNDTALPKVTNAAQFLQTLPPSTSSYPHTTTPLPENFCRQSPSRAMRQRVPARATQCTRCSCQCTPAAINQQVPARVALLPHNNYHKQDYNMSTTPRVKAPTSHPQQGCCTCAVPTSPPSLMVHNCIYQLPRVSIFTPPTRIMGCNPFSRAFFNIPSFNN